MCRQGPRKFNQIRNSLSERRRLENVTVIALAPSIVRPRLPPPFLERDAGAPRGGHGTGRAAAPGSQNPGVLGGGRERSRGSRWEQGKGQGRASGARREPAARWLRTRPSRRSRRCLRCRLTAKVSGAPGSGGEARRGDEAAALGRSPPCPDRAHPYPSTLRPHPSTPAPPAPHAPSATHTQPDTRAPTHTHPAHPPQHRARVPAARRSPQTHVPPRARGHACSYVLRLLTLSALINTADKGRGAGAAGGYLLQAAGPPAARAGPRWASRQRRPFGGLQKGMGRTAPAPHLRLTRSRLASLALPSHGTRQVRGLARWGQLSDRPAAGASGEVTAGSAPPGLFAAAAFVCLVLEPGARLDLLQPLCLSFPVLRQGCPPRFISGTPINTAQRQHPASRLLHPPLAHGSGNSASGLPPRGHRGRCPAMAPGLASFHSPSLRLSDALLSGGIAVAAGGACGAACFRGDFLTLRRFHSKEISRARWERFPSTLPTSVATLV